MSEMTGKEIEAGRSTLHNVDLILGRVSQLQVQIMRLGNKIDDVKYDLAMFLDWLRTLRERGVTEEDKPVISAERQRNADDMGVP